MAHSVSVPPSPTTKALGALGILGGALLLAAWWTPFLPWDHDTFNLRLIVFNLGAIAIAIAVHRRQVSVSRRLSTLSVAAVILANGWYLVMILLGHGRPVFPEPDPEFRRIFFYAAMALWLSDAVFGAVAFRLGAVSRIGAASLAVGSFLAGSFLDLGGSSSPLADLIEALSLVGIFLVGVGWIGLGVDVATKRRPIPSPTS